MKKLSIQKLRKQLEAMDADNATSELVQNNAMLYNDLVDDYKAGGRKNIYVMYQLNQCIHKQIESVKKAGGKTTSEDDPFEQLVSELKNKTVEQR
jgi:hypothetical protein